MQIDELEDWKGQTLARVLQLIHDSGHQIQED